MLFKIFCRDYTCKDFCAATPSVNEGRIRCCGDRERNDMTPIGDGHWRGIRLLRCSFCERNDMTPIGDGHQATPLPFPFPSSVERNDMTPIGDGHYQLSVFISVLYNGKK